MKRRIISVMLAAMLALTPASASASPASLGTGSTEADSAVLEAIAQGAEIEMTKTSSGETEINVVEPETQEEAQTEPQTEETEQPYVEVPGMPETDAGASSGTGSQTGSGSQADPDSGGGTEPVDIPGMPETETAPSLDSDPSADTDMPEEETSSGAAESEETETETEEQLYEVAVQDDEKDNAVVVFAADLLKLKNGTLENPNIDEAEAVEKSLPEEPETKAEVSEAKKEAALKEISLMKQALPDDVAKLLDYDSYKLLEKQEHEFKEGEAVGFYVIPYEGYEIDRVAAADIDGEIEVIGYDNNAYEIVMPDSNAAIKVFTEIPETEESEEETETEAETESETETEPETEKEAEAEEETEVDMSGVDIDTREEIGPPADTVNAGPGADLSMMPAAAAARAATVPVSKVAGNTKLDQNYAFTFAFRGDSALTSISRYNGTIPTKMHSWFGDSAGFTTEYCKTFYGALVESSGTYSSDISVVYSNVGEYQGQTLDLRVTADAWSGINKNHVGRDGTKIMPCILFYKDRIAFNTISVENVRFRFQFLKHGTSTAVNPKGHVTLADLDGGTIGQGIRLYPSLGIDRAYARANDLKISYGSNYTEIRGGKDSTTNSDPDGWVTVNFNGAFGINWLAQGSVSTSTGPMNAFCIFTSQTVGIYEPNPGPEKRVGNQNQAYTAMAKHDSEGAALTTSCGNTFDYIIAQRLLPGNYSSFTLTDTLDSCLTYNSASVTTSGGRNVTNKFSITRSGQTVTFTMNNSFLKTDEAMNDVTYYFRIRVTLKNAATVAAHNHFKGDTFYIPNRASRRIISSTVNDNQNTNYSYVKGKVTGSAKVVKVNAANTSQKLTGASFKIQEWNESQKRYNDLRTMTSNGAEHTSGTLTYTASNKGKFKIVETKAPEGYDGNWSKEIQVMSLGNPTTYTATNTKKVEKYGVITITKKDSYTGKVLTATDGEFKVFQWNKDSGKYEDTLGNNGIISYNINTKKYISKRLTTNDQNQGKFKVTEIKNPTGYEGTFEKEVTFNMSSSADENQEFAIEAENTPIIPPLGEIVVAKKIKESDIIWAHGNPVFRFVVSGTDVKGNPHTYQDYVEFQKGNYTVEGGYAILSCTFENVPIGKYNITERKTQRYAFESLTADTQNVTVSGQTGIATLDVNNRNAGVTFTNKKTSYDLYSHADVIKNTIPIIWE